MAKILTAKSVERLRPDKLRREIPDGGCTGLYLIIQSSGVKSFALRARRPDGRNFKLTLGKYSPVETDSKLVIGAPMTLVAARQLAVELQRDRARGVDVVGRRHTEKLALSTGNGKTFGGAAVDFVEQHARRKTRRWEETARLLGLDHKLDVIKRGLADRWRDRGVTEISCDDVYAVVEEAREHGVPGLNRRNEGPSDARARAMFSALSTMFGWLLVKRRLRINPCVGLARPDAPASRDRVLKDAELISFWKAADAERPEFAAPLKLLALTGCRLNEVIGMRRIELLDGETWLIPGSRTKNRRELLVPLSPMAREVLASVPVAGDYVFSTTGGRRPIACGSKIKSRLDAAMQIEPWVLHDLRRTVATGMAELGIQPHIVEACLNHVSGAKSGVAGIYNRAQYLPEKTAALERWSAHVEGLLSSTVAKVVQLRG